MVLFPKNSTSLAKKYCTANVYKILKDTVTAGGFTLGQALQSGILNPDSTIGIYAGDVESYDVFSPIFDPIIKEYHSTGPDTQQTHDFSPLSHDLSQTDAENILSTRIRVARNIDGFAFTPGMSAEERLRVAEIFRSALPRIQEKFGGDFFSYNQLEREARKELQQRKIGFPRGDRFQEAAGMNRDYPEGRGVYLSEDERIRIWVNEEDHLRLICQDTTADLTGVFTLFCTVHEELQKSITFAHSQRYGYLTACPTNIGTSMRAGVHIRLNNLSRNRPLLDDLAHKNGLQLRGTDGEKTSVRDRIYDISNSRRFGLSEAEIIETLSRGIGGILRAEQEYKP